MTEPIYTDPAGDELHVFRESGEGTWIQTSGSGLLVPDNEVQEFADAFLKALCVAVGLPVPEIVFPIGADNPGQLRTTADGDDWQPYEAGRAVSTQAGDDRG